VSEHVTDAAAGRGGSRLAVLARVLVALWTIGVVVTLPGLAWLVEQLLVAEGLALPPWGWPVVSVLAALLVAAPNALLAGLSSSGPVRAVARTWLAGAALLALLGSVRAVPVPHTTGYLLLLAVTATVATLLLPRVVPFPERVGWFAYGGLSTPRQRLAPAVAAGIGALAPFLAFAALGGLADTVAAALAATAIGALAARLLHRALWPALLGWSRRRQFWLGGLAAGVTLLLLAAGTGGTGVFVLEMLVLPPLGFVLAALRYRCFDRPRPGRRGRAAALNKITGRTTVVSAVLVGLAAFGPLAWVSAAQAWAYLGLEEIGFWGLVAALASLVITLLFAVGYGLWLPHLRRLAAGALVLVMLAGAGVAYAVVGTPGLHGDRLFVVMKEQADLTGVASVGDPATRRAKVYQRLVATAESSQVELRRALDRLHARYTPYYLVNGVEVDGGPGLRALLSRRSDVDRVLLSPHLRPVPERAEPLRGHATLDVPVQPNIAQIGADKVWASGITGEGIVVGSADSGVDGGHPALAGTFRGGEDSWYDPWNHSTRPVDRYGHGTHTMALAVGARGVGVAPAARWIACVNLDRNLADPAYYIGCLQFLFAPFPAGGNPLRDGRPARGADILTNSWGCPGLEGCDARSLRPAVNALTVAGVLVVAAAGNDGPRCDSIEDPPGTYPAALTVGAVDGGDRVSFFSSRGDGRAPANGGKPDLVAPGENILSALPGGGYGRLDGTSMATPQVAGVAALMWSANPALRGDVASTVDLLRRTAAPASAGRCGAAADVGAGRVDAQRAVAAAEIYRTP
jgi:subtilisin family serine protease